MTFKKEPRYNHGRRKGFVPSPESRRQAQLNNPHATQVMTPHGSYASILEASRQTGLHEASISYRLKIGEKQRTGEITVPTNPKRDFRGWYIIGEKKRKTYRQPVRTPYGDFSSVAEAARRENITSAAICHLIRRGVWGYFYLDENGEAI